MFSARYGSDCEEAITSIASLIRDARGSVVTSPSARWMRSNEAATFKYLCANFEKFAIENLV